MAEEGFKVGSAYVEVDVDPDPAIEEAARKLRASKGKFKRAGDDIGTGLGDGIDEGAGTQLEKSPKIKKATEKVAARTQAQFKGLVFAGAFAGLPVAAAAAGAAASLSLAAVPLALVAGAAKLQASNAEVGDSYERLANTAIGAMDRASAPLQGSLIKGATDLRLELTRLEPVFTQAFRNAEPAIDGIVTATTTLAEEAMPGLLLATTKTSVAMRGIDEFSRGAGRGITGFFEGISTGAESSVGIMRTFGGVTEDALTFVGKFLANLSNGGGPVLQAFRNSLTQVYGILNTLTTTGMQPLSQSVGAFITVTSGALAVIGAVASALGSWTSPLLSVASALKAADMLTFGKLSGAFDGLGDSIRSAQGGMGKFQAATSGLLEAALAPTSLALIGLTVGLTLIGEAQQRAAQAAQEHKSRVQDLSRALSESNGVINDNVRAQAAKSLTEAKSADTGKSLVEMAKSLGVSLPRLTDAYLGNASAIREVVDGTEKRLLAEQKGVSSSEQAKQLQERGAAFTEFKKTLTETNSVFGEAVAKNRAFMEASGKVTQELSNMSPAASSAQQAVSELDGAFQTLYSPMSKVEDTGNAIITILDRLAGRTPSFEEAIQSNNDILRGMAKEFTAAGAAADGWGEKLLNADGTVNTITPNGSKLQDTLVDLQSGFANAGASINELVKGGLTFEQAGTKVRDELSRQRVDFVNTAEKILGSREAADKLADSYGLLPDKVVTLVTDVGTAVSTTTDIDALKARIGALPPNTPVRIQSVTAEAEQKLRDIGYVVTHMPDGTVTVRTDIGNVLEQIANAQRVVDSYVRQNDGRVVRIRTEISTGTSTPSDGGRQFNAAGRYQFPAASVPRARHRETGGTLPFLAGLPGAAVTGERGPEVSFPTRSSYVATAQQAQRMEHGLETGARGGTAVLDRPEPKAAPGVVNHFHVTPPPSMDFEALAVRVSRLVERKLKGGA